MNTSRFLSCAATLSVALSIVGAGRACASESSPPAAPVLKADDPNSKLDFTYADLLAVQEDRRKKPLQSHALETIEQMCGRPLMGSTFIKIPTGEPGGDPDNPKSVKFNSTDLFLSIWFFPDFWEDKPLILVSSSELRKMIAPNGKADEKRVSLADIRGSAEFKKLLMDIKGRTKPGVTPTLNEIEKDAQLVFQRADLFGRIQAADIELCIVPHHNDPQGTWPVMGALLQFMDAVEKDPAQRTGFVYDFDKATEVVKAYKKFKTAYQARNAAQFTNASRDFKAALQALSPAIYPSERKLESEILYNNVRPFAIAWIFYLLAGITTLFAIRFNKSRIYASALSLYVIGLAIHIFGFVLRCYIAGRPPVSNMYESVIWVGFGAVMFGLIFELLYRKRYFMLAGSAGGFLCLVLMDLVPVLVGNNDAPGMKAQIEPLQPVLRDNFWLTIHVLTITLSYAAFMLAWGMGHITLWAHLVRPTQRQEHSELHNLVYRVLQLGVLMLAAGTILGGVWAYYSWGRFWGWDPKETWAFIALMCYIVVLHGRFAGLWTNFGLAFGSVFCFQSIVMAWYGVNFVLGTGKHAYGSGAGGRGVVLTCVGLDIAFLAAATTRYLINKRTPKRDDDDDDHGEGGHPAVGSESAEDFRPQPASGE